MYGVLVCGGRDYADREYLFRYMDAVALLYGPDIMVITGSARGADAMAEEWAKERQQIYVGFPAQWDKYGLKAGMKRNSEMAALSGAKVVVVFRGRKGTLGMYNLATTPGLMEPEPIVLLPDGRFWL